MNGFDVFNRLTPWQTLRFISYMLYPVLIAWLATNLPVVAHANWHVTAVCYLFAHCMVVFLTAGMGQRVHLEMAKGAHVRRPLVLLRMITICFVAYCMPMFLAGLYESITGTDIDKGGISALVVIVLGVLFTLFIAGLFGLKAGWASVSPAVPGTDIHGRYMTLI